MPALPFVQQPMPPAAPAYGTHATPWPPAAQPALPPPQVPPVLPPPAPPPSVRPPPPPAMAQSTVMAPPVMAPPPATFGQQLAQRQWSSSDAHSQSVPAPVETPAPRAATRSRGRALELLWCADDALSRAREAPLVAEVFSTDAQAEGQAALRAVHRGLARLSPIDDLALALWDAVDDDGALTPPIVAVTGEIELCFDDAELARTLAAVARPFAEGDGALEERIAAVTSVADQLPDASDLITRALDSLRSAWEEHEIAPPMEELEANARRILLKKRKLRTLSIFEAVHLVAQLRTSAHAGPVPVYLPEGALGRLPLESRFDVQLLAEVHPRQIEDEPCSLVLAVLAVGRVLRGA
ncbi:Outer membrane protein, OmpA/MotB family protein [Minicystis rosea]|nr:Outer membrane protein, OmpA/MotB family protein [Minicystis rosea]